MYKISPSFLQAKDLKKFIYMLEAYNKNKKSKTNINYIHVDVMDNEFVEGTGVSIDSIRNINERKFFSDVHLMVEEPREYIDKAIELGANIITIHIEIPEFIKNLKYLKEQIFNSKRKILIGLAVNPETEISEIMPYIYDIDLVLIMSVIPGKGGQEYISETTKKIKEAKRLITEKLGENDFIIEVDGGINNIKAKLAARNGANMLVVGSYITNAENIKEFEENINKLY